MKLKRMQMQGFKSFADRTQVEFNHQVVGVVGPNGCGKSNIVDSIRWAMGEQSAKGLRGKDMTDVIFAGTPARKPAGFAEVSLIFDNADRLAPAPYTEVDEIMVTRRLYRTGESEYLVNNVKSRLKDVNDLFLGTGSSAKAYAIVAQGKIDEVVLAKPEDRRSLIEEAAGIAKYKVRKLAAERKIEATNQNLDRVHDILKELDRNARSLEKQVEKAEKFREVQKELRQLDEQVIAAKVKRIDEEAALNEDALKASSDRLQAASSLLIELEASLEKSRLESLNLEKITNTDYDKLLQTKEKISNNQTELELGIQKVSLLKNQIEERRKDIERLSLKSEDKKGLREQIQAEITRLEADEKIKDQKLEELQSSLDSAEKLLSDVNTEILKLQKEIAEHKEASAKEVQKLEMLKAERVDFELQRASLEQRIKTYDEQLTASSSELQSFNRRIEEVKKQLVLKKQERESMLARLEQARQKETELQSEFFSVESRKQEKLTSIENLQSLEAHQVGYDSGSLKFKEQTGFSFLMEKLEFKEEFQELGEKLLDQIGQYFLIDENNLPAEPEGRFSYLKRLSSEDMGPEDSVVSLLKTEPDSELKAILSRIKVVDRIDTQATVAQLSRTGDVQLPFSDGLALVSSGPVLKADAPFSRKSEIEAAQTELIQIEENLSSTQRKQEDLRALHENLKTSQARTEKEITDISKELETHQLNISSLRERNAKAEATREGLVEEMAALDRRIDSILVRISEVTGVEDPTELIEKLESLELKKQKLEQDRDACESAWIEFRIETGAFKEKMERLRHQTVEIDMNQSEYQHNQGVFQEDIQSWSSEIQRIETREQDLKSSREGLDDELRKLELTLAETKEKLSVYHRELEESERERKQKQSEKESCSEEVKKLEMQRKDLSFQVEELSQLLMERYQIGLQEAIEHYSEQASEILEDPEKLRQMEERAKYLKDRLTKFGDVNLVALQEFEEIKKRLEFMNTQKEDLLKTLDSLQSIIDRINKITEFRFRETFKSINHNFQLLFPKLFGGGQAYMRLTDENDLLNTGVEIFAEPPGKKIQNMSLLSGGEKAMTSISLIFSLFAYRPSSFCILDEVDAPLDDINTRRYNEIIREMSSLSQFIVITHNKRTMEVADTLFGVTMQDPGVSRMVGVDLYEATAFSATEAATAS